MSIKKDDIVNAIHSDGSDDSYYASSTGSGCVFRFQLDLSFFKPIDTDYKVVPGTFLHQDLIAPNPCYNLIDLTDPSLSHHDKKTIICRHKIRVLNSSPKKNTSIIIISIYDH